MAGKPQTRNSDATDAIVFCDSMHHALTDAWKINSKNYLLAIPFTRQRSSQAFQRPRSHLAGMFSLYESFAANSTPAQHFTAKATT